MAQSDPNPDGDARQPSGQFCTSCRVFRDHSAPVGTSHSTTGESGCPECRSADDFRYVVAERGDSVTVDGGYIPQSGRTDALRLEEARKLAGPSPA